MRTAFNNSCAAGFVGLALACGIAAPLGVAPAHAGDGPSAAEEARRLGLLDESNAGRHQSVVRITDAGGGQVHKTLQIGLGKSVMIETPRPVRDVMVSNPQAVDAVVLSSNRIFLISRRLGESNAFLFDENGEQMATLEVFVEREVAGLESLLRRLIPGSNIKVEMLNMTVVLTGSVRTPADANRATALARQFAAIEFESKIVGDAEGVGIKKVQKSVADEVINLLEVEGDEQVMLRVTVAEVQRSLLKQFGINLGASINSGNFVTQILTENALPLTAAAGLGTLPTPGIPTAGAAAGALSLYNQGPTSGAADAPFGNSGLSSFWNVGGSTITKTLRALERDGLVKTLAEPNLTAVSGESAKFLAGGEYPIPVVDSDGKLTVVYKEFGVGVSFTPIVMSEGRISLKMETEVSELTNNGAVQLSSVSIPALKKRQAKSTVELPSGGSLALAGLISDDVRQNIDGFPGLKDLPVLGTLFRSRDFVKQETELVVIVTPILVRPTSRQELARPLDGLGEASDMKANFLGHLNRIYGASTAAPPTGDLKGDYGFIVE